MYVSPYFLSFTLLDMTDPELRGCVMKRDFLTMDESYRLALMDERGACGIELLMARFGLARAWAAAGEKEKAAEMYKEIISESSDDTGILDFAAFQLMKAGFKKQAKKLIGDLKEKTEDNERLEVYERWLQYLNNKYLYDQMR